MVGVPFGLSQALINISRKVESSTSLALCLLLSVRECVPLTHCVRNDSLGEGFPGPAEEGREL